MQPPDERPVIGFDLARVAAIKQEADEARKREQARRPGRPPRPYAVRRITIELPAELLAAIPGEMTAFIERAIRAALAQQSQPPAD